MVGRRSSRLPRAVDSAWSWLVCACAALSNGLVHAMVFSFGVMLPVLMDEFNDTKEKTALVGSLAVGIAMLTSVLSGRLSDRLGYQRTHIFGSLSCAVALLVSSWATSNSFQYLSFSVLYGVGMSSVLMPCFLIVARYFNRRRCLALGLVSAGPAAGIFVMGPSLQALVDTIGWRHSYRILAGIFAFSCFLSCSFDANIETVSVSSDAPQQEDGGVRRRKLLDFSVCAIPAYTASVISMSLIGFGHFSLQMHLVRHCEELGLSAKKASYLFLGIGLCSLTSRVLVGKICDVSWVNPRYLNQLAAVISGTVTILLTLRMDYIVVVVLMLFYGVADGTYMVTFNALALNTVVPEQRAFAMGYANMALSVSIASGPAITGLVADRLSYTYAFYMAGAVTLFGSAIPLLICCIKDSSGHRTLVDNHPCTVFDADQTEQLVVFEWIYVV